MSPWTKKNEKNLLFNRFGPTSSRSELKILRALNKKKKHASYPYLAVEILKYDFSVVPGAGFGILRVCLSVHAL